MPSTGFCHKMKMKERKKIKKYMDLAREQNNSGT